MLDDRTFTIHDMSCFPLVRARPEAVRPGYAAAWIAEMDALLAQGQDFVLLFTERRPEERHEDRKRRGLWLKHNKDALARSCLSLIVVEPDAVARVALAAQAALTAKAFGTRMDVVATHEDAGSLANRLLSGQCSTVLDGAE
ncbi:hypothetical protein LRS73_03660 [Methylobacterium currus]|uniref:hypothetical protein n=1 Tax=Methylobacterium currus TaxID=2051553 RepID=UPI0015808306|nr:hypothetical protein [Methylobacterium currus]UHC17022.1 hypothetical protein LRS73_03660 [Methylobacterium currus]